MDTVVNTVANTPGLFAGTDPDWELKQQQIAARDAFKDGVPTDANGNADFTAMAKTLMQKGDFANAGALMQTGLAQQQIGAASKAISGMNAWSSPTSDVSAANTSTSPTSTRKASPEVVAYIREKAPTYGINPNVALGVAGSEGLYGFDPTGNANLGDGGSSGGPFQLHYGGVSGGANAAPGLGDDFTKATKLDARDPSTWKQQVDFALAHAAKNGWSAWHGAARAGIGEWTGIGNAPVAGVAPGPVQPVRVAQNGTSNAPTTDAPSSDTDTPPGSVHPYAPTQPAAIRAGAVGISTSPPGVPEPTPGQPPADQTQPAPMPAAFASPPAPSPNAGALTDPGDPSFGGQVPRAWIAAGHSPADWVRYQRTMAGLAGTNPYMKAAGEQWAKAADELQTSINKQLELTGEQKNARDPLVQQSQQSLAVVRAQARADATAENALVPMAQPDGSMTLIPKKVALARATAGDPVTTSLPGYVTSGQQNLLTKLNDGSTAYAERQIAGERLDALSDLLSTYQTGANSTAFNDAAGRLRSLGIDIPNSATINPAAMQQFAKNSYANVLSQMREQGNKQFVSEVQSAINSNPNTDLQPEANASMIAQLEGIRNYHDANFRDYADWYNANKGASNDAQFQIGWAKKNAIGDYVGAARKDIAPLGVAVPPRAQLVDGQAYMVKGAGGQMVKARWSADAKGFVPVEGGSR